MKKIIRFALLLFAGAAVMAACTQVEEKVIENPSIQDPNPNHGATPETTGVSFSAGGQNDVMVRLTTDDITSTLTAVLGEELEDDVVLNISIDREYLVSSDIDLLPADAYSLDNNLLVIPAGERGDEVDITFFLDAVPFGVSYVLPLVLEPESSSVAAAEDSRRVVYTVSHAALRDLEMIAFPEVNNINPLNYGEVLLEDGSPFFDYVVLFAYNINYNADEDRVYLSPNPNCQALLDGTDTFIQPLRRKGIKVLMGLLGNHDAAGLAQLSDWGAQQFAQEVAQAIKTYGMDGVNLDDEYSNSPISGNKWFTTHSAAAGARLAYELKKAMKEAKCDNSIVSIFNWGSFYQMPSVDGTDPSEFIDQCVGNYGTRGTISGNMTNKWATYASYECNNGQRGSAANVNSAKSGGYGFLMYFNPDPKEYKDLFGANGNFSVVAQAAYGQKCQEQKYWYKKTGEGKYDATPYETYPW